MIGGPGFRKYDVVKDFKTTSANAFFGDLMTIREYRQPLLKYLQTIEDNTNQPPRRPAIRSTSEKAIFNSYGKVGRKDIQIT